MIRQKHFTRAHPRFSPVWFVALLALFATALVVVPFAPPAAAATSVTGVVNTYFPVSAVAANSVTVGASSGAGVALTAGDRVLLIQMEGTIAEGRGVFEELEVASVDGGGNPTFVSGPARSYNVARAVQLVRIPWDDTGVDVTGQVTPFAWNLSLIHI